MKFLTTKTETIQIERDIKLPYYLKQGDTWFYKIISKDKAIQISEVAMGISSVSPQLAFDREWDEITETEFETILQNTLNQIIN